ncbi:MAG: hypothetical protein MR964_05105 [Campylobacter sp.]|uniref:hypothetical protein n=1 Tax=Campylobacter sp. TaxID=205 RepID=UPI002AA8C3C1|nr:hypothetical protein [Campylobacter sp.]MCI7023587.1 hypothetical protein [Campylobacter sp.]
MRGTRFELDEQKASKLSGMSVDEVWNFINKKAKEANLIVSKNGEYHAKGTEHDLGDIGVFIASEMVNVEWFTKSIKLWVQFKDDREDDIIEVAKEMNEGIWE